MDGIVDRLLFSALVAGVFVAGAGILLPTFRVWMRARLRRHALPPAVTSSGPALLYFWSAGCAQCRPQEVQIEEAQAVLARRGRTLQVRKVDAVEEKGLAKSMHVMTLPTTIVLDEQGVVAAWNPGLTPSRRIVDQFQRLAGAYGHRADGESDRPQGSIREIVKQRR